MKPLGQASYPRGDPGDEAINYSSQLATCTYIFVYINLLSSTNKCAFLVKVINLHIMRIKFVKMNANHNIITGSYIVFVHKIQICF